jgi:arylsulfatase A-like enzyme
MGEPTAGKTAAPESREGWWHWRGLIAFGAVIVAAGLFALIRHDPFATLLTLIALYGSVLVTSPCWILGGWLVQRWWRSGPRVRRRRLRYLLPAPLALAPALWLVSLLTYHAVNISAHTGLLGGQDRYVVLIVVDGGSFARALQLFWQGARDKTHYRDQINAAFPNISQHVLREGAYTMNGVTIWPSSSVPAHTSIMTGAYPSKHGIQGQRYYDRHTRHHMSFIGPGVRGHQYELSRSVKTLFEYVPDARSVAVIQFANRGCTLYVPGPPEDNYAEHAWQWVVSCLNGLGKRTGQPGVPRLMVISLATIDHLSHTRYLDSPEVVDAYKNVDRIVGRVMDFMGDRDLLDKTTFVLCSDHGIAPVTNHLTIDHVLEDLRFHPFQSLKYVVKTDWGFFESNFWKGTRRKFDHRYDCVALWGGNSDALLYLKGQERDAAGYVVRASWDIVPSVACLENYECGGESFNLIERLLRYSPGIGAVVARASPDEFLVCTATGRAKITRRLLQPPDAAYRYDVLRGQDPLEYSSVPALKPYVNTGRWLTDRQWLDLTCTLRYPDALHRLANSFGTSRAADLDLIAADGWDFTPASVHNRVLTGTHGALNREQSVVPIMFWGRGIKRVELKTGRTVDIVPTILKLLNVPYDPNAVSGKPLDVLAEEPPARTSRAPERPHTGQGQ